MASISPRAQVSRASGNHPVRGHDRRHHHSGPETTSGPARDAGSTPPTTPSCRSAGSPTSTSAASSSCPRPPTRRAALHRLLDLSRRRRRARRRLSSSSSARCRRRTPHASTSTATATPAAPACATYLCDHSVSAAASYVNTVGRTVNQIRPGSAAARRASSTSSTPTSRHGATDEPRQVRAAIQEFVEREPSLAWARQPAAGPDCRVSAGRKSPVRRWSASPASCCSRPSSSAPPLYLALPPLARKRTTSPGTSCPDDALIQTLAAQEDHGVQNPFTSAGFVKPGPFRKLHRQRRAVGHQFPGAPRLQPRRPDRREDHPLRTLGLPRPEAAAVFRQQLRRQPRKLHGRLRRQDRLGPEHRLQQRRRLPATRACSSSTARTTSKSSSGST